MSCDTKLNPDPVPGDYTKALELFSSNAGHFMMLLIGHLWLFCSYSSEEIFVYLCWVWPLFKMGVGGWHHANFWETLASPQGVSGRAGLDIQFFSIRFIDIFFSISIILIRFSIIVVSSLFEWRLEGRRLEKSVWHSSLESVVRDKYFARFVLSVCICPSPYPPKGKAHAEALLSAAFRASRSISWVSILKKCQFRIAVRIESSPSFRSLKEYMRLYFKLFFLSFFSGTFLCWCRPGSWPLLWPWETRWCSS